jgi:hypothetical protein
MEKGYHKKGLKLYLGTYFHNPSRWELIIMRCGEGKTGKKDKKFFPPHRDLPPILFIRRD